MSEKQQDESTVLSTDRTSDGDFFIDDYSHLRLSYYQYRDAMALEVSDSAFHDSAYSTNASTNQCFDENDTQASSSTMITNISDTNFTNTSTNSNSWGEVERQKRREYDECNVTKTTSFTNATNSTNTRANSKYWDEEERRKRRAYYMSQIPDLPHPAYTVASVIASASHRMNPKNRFVYNNRIEKGPCSEDDIGKFTPSRRSTLKPDAKL